MGKKAKAGFNTPFASLRGLKQDKPAKAAPARPPPPEPETVQDDATLFVSAMSGVAPIVKRTSRIEPVKRETSALPDDEQLALLELESLVQGKGEFRVFESEEDQSGAAPGVSFALLARLKEGQFAFRRHLDLHGMSRDDAKVAVTRFVTTARRDGEHCVLVVTGRGKGSPGGISVLRETLPRWLSRQPLHAHVLAFCTALQVDGGPGAFYVLLRRPGVRPFGVP
jgi:DNA-nicking Smr family endonuclease